MDDINLFKNPAQFAKSLHLYVIDYISKEPKKELVYYFPLGHSKENSPLANYKGKYSKQDDFILFRDQSSCITVDEKKKVHNE